MDKANLALAQYLADRGTPVYVVCHSVDAELAAHKLVTATIVKRPLNSFFLARPLLDRTGRNTAKKLLARWPSTQVVVNGDNCLWPGVNWVHYVHQAWFPKRLEGPFLFRTKIRIARRIMARRERYAARIARILITNSNRTTRDLVTHFGVDPAAVRTVYLGAESTWGQVTGTERAEAREALKISPDAEVVLFLGSLGFDHRKGFDVLLEAWRILSSDPNWRAQLLVAGEGNATTFWRQQVSTYGLDGNVRILGFSDRVPELLAASDLLVSPVRYEAYGLNVQEAVSRGIPALVSAQAGVAEKYRDEFSPMLLPDPEDVPDLVVRLQQWHANKMHWAERFRSFGHTLRGYGWEEMAREFVSIVENGVAVSRS
jgi:glycosyltransferase involved in cell wall biosynthesis